MSDLEATDTNPLALVYRREKPLRRDLMSFVKLNVSFFSCFTLI